MRMIVFFDLPVTTKNERKTATAFRKFLLDNGYYMLQFSVYSRLCNSTDNVDTHYKRLSAAAPKGGSIRCMIVTEKQYSSMKILVGTKSVKEIPAKCVQLSFL